MYLVTLPRCELKQLNEHAKKALKRKRNIYLNPIRNFPRRLFTVNYGLHFHRQHHHQQHHHHHHQQQQQHHRSDGWMTQKIVQIKIWRKFSSSSVAIALSGNEQTTTNIIIIRMSKFKLILILFVAPFLIEAQEGNVAEIFMDTSYNLDFGSSLYNDLSYFFANVSPDGNYCQHCENPQHIFSQWHLSDWASFMATCGRKFMSLENQCFPNSRIFQ